MPFRPCSNLSGASKSFVQHQQATSSASALLAHGSFDDALPRAVASCFISFHFLVAGKKSPRFHLARGRLSGHAQSIPKATHRSRKSRKVLPPFTLVAKLLFLFFVCCLSEHGSSKSKVPTTNRLQVFLIIGAAALWILCMGRMCWGDCSWPKASPSWV